MVCACQIGKKKLKAVARTLRGLSGSPRALKARSALFQETSLFRISLDASASPYEKVPPHSFLKQGGSGPRKTSHRRLSEGATSLASHIREPVPPHRNGSVPANQSNFTKDQAVGAADDILRDSKGSPVQSSVFSSPRTLGGPMLAPPILLLPDPAMDPGDGSSAQRSSPQFGEMAASPNLSQVNQGSAAITSSEPRDRICRVGALISPKAGSSCPIQRKIFGSRQKESEVARPFSSAERPRADGIVPTPRAQRGPTTKGRDAQLDVYQEFDLRQSQFFAFLDKELGKIESFYQTKEDEANDRFRALKQQLREMHLRRIEEATSLRQAREKARADKRSALIQAGQASSKPHGVGNGRSLGSLARFWSRTQNKVGADPRSPASTDQRPSRDPPFSPRSSPEGHMPIDDRRDFVRRKQSDDGVPFRQAKRKLKAALAEYYRGLELLKSYALLNRTAFRKLSKKYDKTVDAYFGSQYVAEKVNQAWFVQSAVPDSNMRAIEDLYANYFERGNHKVAVGKLKTKSSRAIEYHGSVYRNGLLGGVGVVMAVQGMIAGVKLLFQGDPLIRLRTAFLLQVRRAERPYSADLETKQMLGLRRLHTIVAPLPLLLSCLWCLVTSKDKLCLHL